MWSLQALTSITILDTALRLGNAATEEAFTEALKRYVEIDLGRNPDEPFPLNGGRAGLGVWPLSSSDERSRAPAPSAPAPHRTALTPISGPSPIEGEGSVLALLGQFRQVEDAL